ncbi:DUF2380 domain-containing protein [Stigmatella erecta]|uniref:DUF2380 domain-containing protein n=1 Tax=Stigmatella erecta TaxID=83460 RepID=A0A1I0KVB6_9BACT|nr:DUF2380 domain-containing protein [Stigmatella erecta]SEU29810.1 hypothetical protein SAMN05443639_1152 [Stigmatella erecta]
MRLAIALGCMAALLTSCAAGSGGSGLDRPYQKTDGTAGHAFLTQKPRASAASGPERQRATQVRKAFLGTLSEVKRSTDFIAVSLRQLTAHGEGLGHRANGVFGRSIGYGTYQLRWIQGALDGANTVAEAALETAEPDMELGMLRMSGPRLQAAMAGATLLAAWLDFLSLAEGILRQCPLYSTERLWADMNRVQRLIEPSMKALASRESGQVEAAIVAMPGLMGQLTREFHSIRESARIATERGGQLMAAAQFVEMLTLVSAMKMSLPRLPPAAPTLVGANFVMGSNGVMMGSQLIVTAEWVERMRRLVQAGVLSLPAISAGVRFQAGAVMMSQSRHDLPQGVRDALGDGPEVRAMRETSRSGAGMADSPQHHVLPKEHREWFEKRGFTGDMNIDHFCVEMEMAHHQAIHGGGNWRLGRQWPSEWNQVVMRDLRNAELLAGRALTRNEVLRDYLSREENLLPVGLSR